MCKCKKIYVCYYIPICVYMFLHMPKYIDNWLEKHTINCTLLPQKMGERMGQEGKRDLKPWLSISF